MNLPTSIPWKSGYRISGSGANFLLRPAQKTRLVILLSRWRRAAPRPSRRRFEQSSCRLRCGTFESLYALFARAPQVYPRSESSGSQLCSRTAFPPPLTEIYPTDRHLRHAYRLMGPDALNLLSLRALGLVEVPTELQAHPEVGRRAEEPGEPQCRAGSDTAGGRQLRLIRRQRGLTDTPRPGKATPRWELRSPPRPSTSTSSPGCTPSPPAACTVRFAPNPHSDSDRTLPRSSSTRRSTPPAYAPSDSICTAHDVWYARLLQTTAPSGQHAV